MDDFEREIALEILGEDGVDAVYVDKEGGEHPVRCLFWSGHVEIDAMGNPIDDVRFLAAIAKSALGVALSGGTLIVDGLKYPVTRRPQSDGRVWVQLNLGDPVDSV